MARNIRAGETFELWAPDPPSFLAPAPALGDQVERVRNVIEGFLSAQDTDATWDNTEPMARAAIAAMQPLPAPPGVGG